MLKEGDAVYALVSKVDDGSFSDWTWFWAMVPGRVLRVERVGSGLREGEYDYLVSGPAFPGFNGYNKLPGADVFRTPQAAMQESSRRLQEQAKRLVEVATRRERRAARG